LSCSFSWNENWVEKGEDGSRKHYCGLVFFTTTFYILSVIAVILLYIFYASQWSCRLNIFFITLNLILCLIVSIVSVLPSVQDYHSTSGLLQSSFVTLYVVFLTWSAMTSERAGTVIDRKNFLLSFHSSFQIRNAILHGNNGISVVIRPISLRMDIVQWVYLQLLHW
jgi:Serine incorporator (Serinc)